MDCLNLSKDDIIEGEELLNTICLYYKKIYNISDDKIVSIVNINVLVEENKKNKYF